MKDLHCLINLAGVRRRLAMLALGAAALGSVALSTSAIGQVRDYPASFRTQRITTNGATLSVRVGGTGPAVVLIHGYGESGDMWEPLAVRLAADHTVIVPDLRGMGMSDHVESGFDKKTQAGDIAGVLETMKIDKVDVVAHDIGNMVAYAFTAQHPARVGKLVLMDAPIPGVGPWDEILKNPLLWHFRFGGPDMERLVHGRERIYLDRFWNEFSADPKRFDEASRRHYARLYARPGAMRAGFAQFHAFDQDAADNKVYLAQGPLRMPVLAIGGEKSFGDTMAAVTRFAASNVKGVVIADSGHWLMEEQPTATTQAIAEFLQ
jgi:pimeloyl-ACP methyl ester carboxylesterase